MALVSSSITGLRELLETEMNLTDNPTPSQENHSQNATPEPEVASNNSEPSEPVTIQETYQTPENPVEEASNPPTPVQENQVGSSSPSPVNPPPFLLDFSSNRSHTLWFERFKFDSFV